MIQTDKPWHCVDKCNRFDMVVIDLFHTLASFMSYHPSAIFFIVWYRNSKYSVPFNTWIASSTCSSSGNCKFYFQQKIQHWNFNRNTEPVQYFEYMYNQGCISLQIFRYRYQYWYHISIPISIRSISRYPHNHFIHSKAILHWKVENCYQEHHTQPTATACAVTMCKINCHRACQGSVHLSNFLILLE